MTDKVHLVLDEASTLGRMEVIEDVIDKLRGYGIRGTFCYQSIGQLKKCWPEGQDVTFLANTTQVFFGVSDNATAEYISARLGETTIQVDSGGETYGRSWQNGANQPPSAGGSTSYSDNWQPQARKLLKPDEVMALSPRTAISFCPGLPPLKTELMRYYEEPEFAQEPTWLNRCLVALQFLAFSVFFCFMMICFAVVLTNYLAAM